ncbi:hypothetical protein GCM10018785_63060 [Streptomyces longispororuber]|uniref:Uncharacterized protein n=1 Tax=Streptomyces longispororuber TaxID=68230 RepID=A0A919DWX9_9ACTN|nr:hypothetical protein GCM10018785_63060 [Streptomyces longispororuber]
MLRPLSRLGRTASTYWNVNAAPRLSLAENGLISSSFDTLDPQSAYGARPGAWQPLLHGLNLEGWSGCGACLTAVERATGARFDQAWVQGTHRAVRITPVPDYLLGQELIHSRLLKREPFISYLAALGPAVLGRMRRHALDLALAHAGLREHPLALAALTADTLPAAAREKLREDLAAAHDQAIPRAFAPFFPGSPATRSARTRPVPGCVRKSRRRETVRRLVRPATTSRGPATTSRRPATASRRPATTSRRTQEESGRT